MGRRFVIVNADDLNHAEAINQAIGDLLARGVVRSASVIVNRDVLNSTVDVMRAFPEASFGLHFNLTRYGPLAPRAEVSTLFAFPDRASERELLLRASDLPPSEVERELVAQYDAFCTICGRKPSHIDSHHYIHSIPSLFRVVERFCAALRLPLRRPFNPYGVPYTRRVDPAIPVADRLLVALRGEPPSWDRWDHSLRAVRPGWTEFVVHATTETGHDNEWKVLKSESCDRAYEAHGVTFASYRELRNAH